MKPLLIVDDYGAGAYDEIVDLEFWSSEGVVEFREDLQEPERLQVDEFAAVFIHANHPKLNWIIPRLGDVPSIQFTGGQISDSGISGTTYYTTRSDFYDRVEEIVERYVEKESICAEDLQPPSKRRRQASSNEFPQSVADDDPAYNESEIITFDERIKTPDRSTQTYPLVWSEGGSVDFVETLRPLALIDKPTPIYLEEFYTDRVGGLEILLRLRLGDALGGSFSRFPVFVRLSSPEATLSEADPSYVVALMETAQYGAEFPNSDSVLQDGVLSAAEIESFLDRVPLRTRQGTDHHDLSNAWGAFRLWRGYRLLSGASTEWRDMPADLYEERDRLLRRKYYMYLAAHSAVFESSTEDLAGGDITDPLGAWSRAVEQHGGDDDPIQVLLIEDEADKGWEVVLQSMIVDDENCVELEVIPKSGPFDYLDALSEATGGSWDAILCDLRLSSWKDPDHTASSDPTEKSEYSGVDLVSEIKSAAPFVPIIAFTSSNNVWTIEATEDAGVQHYWVKESPKKKRNDAYSQKSAAELLTAIKDSVARRRKWRFLEELFSSLSTRRQEDRYTEMFARITSKEEVKKRLKAIEKLLRRAYGFCYRSPSTFQRDELEHSREDSHNHVFLQLWGCLNEILQLRFHNPERKRCRMLRSDGSAEIYWETPNSGGERSWVEEYLGSEGSDRKPLSIYPFKSDAKSGPDWVYVTLLLRESGREDLEDPFKRCKDLRNSIDIIHGHTTNQAESVRFDKHLLTLADVIEDLLFLPAGNDAF